MILQALKDYYYRKAHLQEAEAGSETYDPGDRIAPPGFEWKEIPWVIVLDRNGMPVVLEDTRERKGKKVRARKFLVPHSVIRGNDLKANLLWDGIDYALGIDIKGKGDPERTEEQHRLFKEEIKKLSLDSDEAVKAVRLFLDRVNKIELLSSLDGWKSMMEDKAPNVTFRLAGDSLTVGERRSVSQILSVREDDSLPIGTLSLIHISEPTRPY